MTHSVGPDPRALLQTAAPELGDEPLVLRTDQYGKAVWAVGARHVLRVARTSEVRAKLARERALLARLAGRTTLEIPRPVYAASDDGFDLLLRAPGEPVDYAWFSSQKPAVQRTTAVAFGRFPAELHDAATADEARVIGLPAATPDHPPDWIRERLAGRMNSAQGERLLEAVLAVADAIAETALPPVLLHDDIGHHNAGFDLASGQVLGMFDFTEARVGDPHQDLRYAFSYEPFAEEMIRTYERLRRVELHRARLRALHAWSALTALAWDLCEPGNPENLGLRRGWVNRVAEWDLRFLDSLA